MALKLITFDVTGTLVLLKESVGQQYAKVGLRHGIDAPPDALSKNFHVVFKKMLSEYPNFGQCSIGWEEWWKRLVSVVFQHSLRDRTVLQSPVTEKISSDLIEVYKTKECWKLAKDAVSLLDNFQKKQLRLGVISNYDPRLQDILKDLGILKYFNFVTTSYNAKCQKPYSGIFKVVEDMNPDLKKSEILHIGDNPTLDFCSARQVGWNALLIAENLINVKESFPDIEEDWIVKDTGEIFQKLVDKKLI